MEPTTPGFREYSLYFISARAMKIMRVNLLFILLISFSSIFGQTAPDFTVTDSQGNIHKLFADYLHQDKTVVLKIFFVACPPCNAIAPHLEPLYQKWGGGQADVQFIELSVLQSDTDAKINVYKDSHNTTFPAVGGQGGSVAAAEPYKNGTFGVYTGTPTFVVIAPDKTVNYDVFGSGIQGTVDAIDAAIEATGATGITTSTSLPEQSLDLDLLSKVVSDVLILNYHGGPTKLNATIMNTNGQIYTSAKFPIDNTTPIRLNVSGMATGSWIIHIQDTESYKMASFLFIKQ